MFKPVPPKLDVVKMENAILSFWRAHDIFGKVRSQRAGGPEYVFYEGPPTANGMPGIHHVLARSFKDIFPRYKTMRGYNVSRRGGWDTHGLPVEIEVEKRLGFTDKRQIEEYGIDRFNEMCRKSVFMYIRDWEKLTERIAFWVGIEDAYVTYTNEYIESVWWILKQFWQRGLLYQGYKVVPYCPRCGTPLSDHEVAQGYRDTDDPSLFVRLPLVDDPSTSLLVWTTTPWTLPGNVAVAVHPEEEYVIVERDLPDTPAGTGEGKEKLILARALLENVLGDDVVEMVDSFPGKRLKDKAYQPLFTFSVLDKAAHYVVLEDFVSVEDGTGLVHIAPAFGAEDMQVAEAYDLPVLIPVEEDGTFGPEVRPWRGKSVKEADPHIMLDLEARGLILRAETTHHSYPFCWRCDTPLLYYARSTWYVRTTQEKDLLMECNQQINWVPEHIKDGRFGNWLENNVDWALGRERYWGTPLPVWECQSCQHQVCVGSVAELEQLNEGELPDLDLHRPYVDHIHLVCPECGDPMQRVPEVIDAWFDSGSMPVAQWHYPFENQEIFERQFPADYICEGVDQTRGWFYSLHAISTLLFGKESFKNVISLGLILDEAGSKMSTARGNVVDPWEVLNVHGADALRWYLYTASPPGQERRFSVPMVAEVVRNFTLTLWNVYSFFATYSNLDRWIPTGMKLPRPYTSLDRWLLSELNILIRDVTTAYEIYDVLGATRPIEVFLEQLSNWYLRRSRRRFWKSQADADKDAAYTTLYTVLVSLSKLLAPAMPFLAEELYQNLVRRYDSNAPESVHLADWPLLDLDLLDETLSWEMALVMKLASLGHAARNKAGIKVRQPLAEATFSVGNMDEVSVLAEYTEVLAEELNMKRVRALGSAGEVVTYSLNPLPKQLGSKYKADFPKVRAALLALEPAQAARLLMSGEPLEIVVDDEALVIFPDEVEVRAEARSGLVVASEGAYLAAISTELPPELVREGLAREFIRRIQDFRRRAEFDVPDRIRIHYLTGGELSNAVDAFRDYIMEETFCVALIAAEPEEGMFTGDASFDGQKVKVGLIKVS